jgi:hypothetical protein
MSQFIKNQNLIDDINSGKVILWVGSGYSRRLGFPDWKTFIFKLAEKYFENEPDILTKFKLELYQDGCDLISILERFDKDKREPLFKILPEIFKLPYSDRNDPKALPFKKLWKLSDKIITTNYDLSLSEAKDTDCRTIVWNRKEDYKNFVEKREKYLFKIHGTIKDPKNCIIFKDQYDEVYCSSVEANHEKETFYFLRHLITDHRILFIGYGGFDDDFYIDSTFEYVHKVISSFSDKRHYILKHKNSKINRDYFESFDYDDYNQLDLIIDELLSHVRIHSATSDQIDSYIPEYIGRVKSKEKLTEFLQSEKDHFLFIWGRGGMGKTHLLKTVLDEIEMPFLYYKLNATTTIQSLSEHLNLGIVIDNDLSEEYSVSFINAIKCVNRLIIFDDFYEIDTRENPNPKLRKTLLQLKDSKNNKVIILSRVLDTTFEYLSELKIDFLTFDEHAYFIKAYIKYRGEHLHFENIDETTTKIWKASRGYPLVAEILLDILGQPYRYSNFDLDKFGSFDYEKYDKENNEGKEYLDKLINVVLNGKDEKSREFLFNFSIGLKEMPIELLEKLPESIQFKAEQRRKDYIIINEYENKRFTFSLHPLVWELLRKKAGNRPEVHQIFGNYYLNQFINNYDNIEDYNLAEYHFNHSSIESLNNFNDQIKKIIDSGNVKDILSNNIEATIVRLTLKRKYASNAAITHQLAIQYYLLKKYEKALHEIEIGLIENVGNEHLLLYKAIIYKELKDFVKTEEALLEILQHNEGHIHARNEIGILYREWAKEKRAAEKEAKVKQAEEWLKPLAEEKNILARNEIGILYREWAKEKRADEKEAKFKQAEEWLSLAIEQGNLPSRNEIGILYREWAKEKRADEKEAKFKQAEEWLSLAIEQGNLPSRNEIGILYREWAKEKRADEKEAKFKQAEEWLKPLAEEKNILARNEIGILYREWAKEKRADEKEAKFKQAEEWLKPLAEEKNILARNEIGILYREWAKEKRAAEKEAKVKQAEEWLKPLAEEKNILARNEIGILYREWAKEKRADEKEAKFKQAEEWLSLAIEQGNLPSRNEIGILYREWAKEKRADEKEAKFKQAEEWLSLAIEQGNLPSRNEIGILYREWAKEKRADEKEAKFKQAEEWLSLAIEQGNLPSRNEIGILYREWAKEKRADEKEAKFKQAEEWLKPLAEEKNILARNEIGILYREWAKEKRADEKEAKFKQAEEWLKPLAEEKNILARNEIGILYREWAKEKRADEKEAKFKQAEEWLKPLAEEKNILARNEIGILYREWAKEKRADEKEAKFKQAEEWLKPLAEEKNILARNEIGILYREWAKEKRADEKEAKFKQAEEWLKPLAEEKHIHARNEIGILYREWAKEKRADEKEAKFKQAEEWLKPLAEEKHIHARNEIGILYREWAKEKRADEKEAKFKQAEEWLKPLAEEKNFLASNELSLLYRFWGCENYKINDRTKIELSKEWYLKTIRLKEDNIQSYDGLCRVLILLEEFEECEKWGNRALKIRKNDSRIIKIMVELYYYHLNNNTKALEFLDKVQNTSRNNEYVEKWKIKLINNSA